MFFFLDTRAGSRCREWYYKAIQYGFKGTLQQAFPFADINDNSSRDSYIYWQTSTGESTYWFDGCENARQIYTHLFDIHFNSTSNEYYSTVDTSTSNNSKYDIFWSRYVFEDGIIGLTVSVPLQNETTGDLISIIGVDYGLDYMTTFLTNSVVNLNNDIIGESNEAWIFESMSHGTDTNYAMIASSAGNVTYTQSGITGTKCENSDTILPYDATNHPDNEIQIISKVITHAFGIDNVEINGTDSQELVITNELPTVEMGRAQFWPGFVDVDGDDTVMIGIDWMVTAAFDLSDYNNQIKRFYIFALNVSAFIVFITVYCLGCIASTKQTETIETGKDDKLLTTNHSQQKNVDFPSFDEIKQRFEDIVGVNGALGKSWKNYLNPASNSDPKLTALSTSTVNRFIIKRACKYLEYFGKNESSYANSHKLDKFYIFDECYLDFTEKKIEKRILKIFSHKWYHSITEFFVLVHILVVLFEWPSNAQWNYHQLVTATICSWVEFLDILAEFLVRWIRLNARKKYYDAATDVNTSFYIWPWRVILRSILSIGVLYDTIVWISEYPNRDMVTGFSTFIVLPLLLILNNDSVYESCVEFFQAFVYGKDVLIGYLGFVFIAAVIGMAFLKDDLDSDSIVDSFIYLPEALIVCFILLTTQENYDGVLYTALQKHKSRLAYFFTFIMISVFVTVPYLVSKFESLFIDARKKAIEDKKCEKIYSIVAAFIVLKGMNKNHDGDVNGNSINNNSNDLYDKVHKKQCKMLFNEINNYNLSETNKYCQKMHEMEPNTDCLTIDSFVTLMLDFLTNGKDKEVGTINTSKHQSYWECKFRQPYMIYITLFFGIAPGLLAAAMNGLFDDNSNTSQTMQLFFDILLIVSFFFNIIEISFKIYAFGRRRYFKFDYFRDPPYVAYKCIKNDCRSYNNSNNDFEYVFLSKEDREWAANLESCSKLTIGEKRMLSIVLKFDFVVCFVGLAGLLLEIVIYHSTFSNWTDFMDRCRVWLQIPLIRVFTVITRVRGFMYAISTVLWQLSSFVALALLITFMFACIGVWAFHDKSRLVIDDIYSTDTNANFDNLEESMIALMQIFIGEGWHDVMYLNIITAKFPYLAVLYFVLYVIITMLWGNIFIGAVLAGVKQLK